MEVLMKKNHLLAGSAAAALAVAAFATPASAEFVVKLGGTMDFYAGYAGDSLTAVSNANRTTAFWERFTFDIKATNKADNGLEYGAEVHIRTDQGGTGSSYVQADKSYAFVNGNFGKIEAGSIVGYLSEARSGVLDWGTGANVDGWPTSRGVNGGSYLDVRAPLSNDWSNRINYVTPRIAGIEAGVSYSPRSGDTQGNFGSFLTGCDNVGGGDILAKSCNNGGASAQDIYEIGADYVGQAGPAAIHLNAGYTGADIVSGSALPFNVPLKNLSAFDVGGKIGYAGLEVGGDYIYAGQSGYARIVPKALSGVNNQQSFNVGLQYTTGPILVGANYAQGEGGNAWNQEANYYIGGARHTTAYGLGATYTVAPGFSVGAEYDRFAFTYAQSSLVAGGADETVNVAMLTTHIAF
jgi:outer membrane protein OmpU